MSGAMNRISVVSSASTWSLRSVFPPAPTRRPTFQSCRVGMWLHFSALGLSRVADVREPRKGEEELKMVIRIEELERCPKQAIQIVRAIRHALEGTVEIHTPLRRHLRTCWDAGCRECGPQAESSIRLPTLDDEWARAHLIIPPEGVERLRTAALGLIPVAVPHWC